MLSLWKLGLYLSLSSVILNNVWSCICKLNLAQTTRCCTGSAVVCVYMHEEVKVIAKHKSGVKFHNLKRYFQFCTQVHDRNLFTVVWVSVHYCSVIVEKSVILILSLIIESSRTGDCNVIEVHYPKKINSMGK